jgi:hypothetical protein
MFFIRQYVLRKSQRSQIRKKQRQIVYLTDLLENMDDENGDYEVLSEILMNLKKNYSDLEYFYEFFI